MCGWWRARSGDRSKRGMSRTFGWSRTGWYPQLCLVVGEVPSTHGGEGLHGLRTVKPVQVWQRLGGYWFRPAVTPPSTSQIAPVTQPAWSERRKVTTAETSSVVPIRPIGWKALNPARTVSTSAGGMKPS